MWSLGIAVLSALVVLSSAAVEADPPHILSNLPEPSTDITTAFFFPANPDKKFTAGKLVEIAAGFHNDGSETYNISLIAGSLNAPSDFSMHLQNFTQMAYGQALAPGQQVSLEYKFLPDGRLDPREWTVALTAFYSNSKGEWFSTTFFNQTINIVEVKRLIDWELLFLIVLLAAALGAGAWKAYTTVASLGWIKHPKKRTKTRRAPGEVPVMTAEDQDEWVKGTPYDNFRKRNATKAAANKK